MSITITEALAEIKTIGKRLDKKRDFIGHYLVRQEGVKDPLEKDGGSTKVIESELQAIQDLETRIISLRRGIQHANDDTTITISGVSRTISEWLTWRRDVAPGRRTFLTQLRTILQGLRDKARSEGISLVTASTTTPETRPTDLVISVDEKKLSDESEQLEEILGTLDGQLSLKNATVTIKE